MAVKGSLAAIPVHPEDLHMNQDEQMGIVAMPRLDKSCEVTQPDLELQTGGLNNMGYLTIPVRTKQRFKWKLSALSFIRTAMRSRKASFRVDQVPCFHGILKPSFTSLIH